MAKKTTKYELSRKDIADTLSELIGKLEDNDVMHTSPSDLEEVLNEVISTLEGLCDDVNTKA